MEALRDTLPKVMDDLLESWIGDDPHADTAVSRMLADLESWEARKKEAAKALNARFAEERDALREQLRSVLAGHADFLMGYHQIELPEAAMRMAFEFPDVPLGVVAGACDLHPSKLSYMLQSYRWPVGGECRACHEPFTISDRKRVASYRESWTPPPFCENCRPRCKACGVRFDLSNESDEMLDRMAGGEQFHCMTCADKDECNSGIDAVEQLQGQRLLDTSRERAHKLFSMSREMFWDALLDTTQSFDPHREGANACALFALKVENRLFQLGVKTPEPKPQRRRRSSAASSGGRAWTGSYADYLLSSQWRAKREWALERADYKCQLCSATRGQRTLHVHHNSYDRLGAELPADLIVLCDSCHFTFHERAGLN